MGFQHHPNFKWWLGMGFQPSTVWKPGLFLERKLGASRLAWHIHRGFTSGIPHIGNFLGFFHTTNLSISHHGSMEKWYIYLHEWLKFMINVGKYTIFPWIRNGFTLIQDLTNRPSFRISLYNGQT